MSIDGILQKLQEWVAKNNDDVLAVGYIGSWARGTARPDSDLDLIIVTTTPDKYLETSDWTAFFGVVREVKSEDWGLVQSRRAFYEDDAEIEFGITTKDWTKTNPVDEGTKKVVQDGMAIVYDPQNLLKKILDAVYAK